MMIGSLLARKVGLTTRVRRPQRAVLHAALQSPATLVCSVVAVTSYAFVQPGPGTNPTFGEASDGNMLSAALMMLGTVLILAL